MHIGESRAVTAKESKGTRKITIGGMEIYLDGFLKQKLDYAKLMQKKDFDVPILIDGGEGCGKSTLAITCAWYLSDGKMSVYNIAEHAQDAAFKLEKLPDKSILIIDEGDLAFSSKEVMTKEQRKLEKIFKIIRQKNMILIIVAPSFFDLSKYIAVHRTRLLIHVYVKGFERGRFAYFNEYQKKRLYSEGKKNYGSYDVGIKPLFRGRFTDFRPPFFEEYLKTKKKSLIAAFKDNKAEITRRERTYLYQRNNLIEWAFFLGMKQKEISEKVGITSTEVSRIVNKVREDRAKAKEEAEKEEKR